MFALMKLESYGFHKSHCIEALDVCKGNVDECLELLSAKYFPSFSTLQSSNQKDLLLELREDEKAALQSIFDTAFEEKIPNHIWQLKMKIDHLLVHSPSEVKKRREAELEKEKERKNGKQTPLCKNFLKGNCKFGGKCRFSHKLPETSSDKQLENPELDNTWFYLEIRFPKGNLYPYEAPLIFLKTTCPDIPRMLCLRIARRLTIEAQEYAKNEMPSVYAIADLLQLEHDIGEFLKTDRHQFLDAKKSLFFVENNLLDSMDIAKELPTHYSKGKKFYAPDFVAIRLDFGGVIPVLIFIMPRRRRTLGTVVCISHNFESPYLSSTLFSATGED